MFWKKILCEQCNKKERESRCIYSRGSYFCGEACRDAWTAANPPPVAKGTPESLRTELELVADGALDEYHRAFNLGPRRLRVAASVARQVVGAAAGQLIGSLANMNAQHEAVERQQSLMMFHTHLLRCAPLLRALGHAAEAADIEGIDLMKLLERGELHGRVQPVMAKLEQIRG
jgi:hypothetical protein